MNKLLTFAFLIFLALPLHAEESWFDSVDLDPFDGDGWTPRYMYLDNDNLIGYSHYTGLSYYKKAGAESEGVTMRGAFGNKGEKINLAYSNSFSFMSVDFGLSYYFLNADNERKRDLEGIELLSLEMGLRFWVINFVGSVTETTSFITLGYGF